jgi:hypothetical protein
VGFGFKGFGLCGFVWVFFCGLVWLFLCILYVYLGAPYAFLIKPKREKKEKRSTIYWGHLFFLNGCFFPTLSHPPYYWYLNLIFLHEYLV